MSPRAPRAEQKLNNHLVIQISLDTYNPTVLFAMPLRFSKLEKLGLALYLTCIGKILPANLLDY